MGGHMQDATKELATLKRSASTAVNAARRYANVVLRLKANKDGCQYAQSILEHAEKLHDMVRD